MTAAIFDYAAIRQRMQELESQNCDRPYAKGGVVRCRISVGSRDDPEAFLPLPGLNERIPLMDDRPLTWVFIPEDSITWVSSGTSDQL
jgi:hypothetical protein